MVRVVVVVVVVVVVRVVVLCEPSKDGPANIGKAKFCELMQLNRRKQYEKLVPGIGFVFESTMLFRRLRIVARMRSLCLVRAMRGVTSRRMRNRVGGTSIVSSSANT